MPRGTRSFGPLAALVLLTATGAVRAQPPAAPAPRPAVVYVVDGAGGFEATSRSIRRTVAEHSLPLDVRCFHWTHGYCRVFADQVHLGHMRREGQRLAEELLRCRHEEPRRGLFLIGHSAGCGLALIAAGNLPPDTLDRVILLAPAVSATYDLRPALASARRGMDVFISGDDWACLGIGTLLAGTTDHCRTRSPAGKVGFRPIVSCDADAALYARLRHYPWDATLKCTGHTGGHYGSYQPGYFRLFVLPLLTTD